MFKFKNNAALDAAAQAAAISKSQAVIEFELDGTVITANQNFLNAMGYSLAEIQGKHHSMFVEPAMRDSAAYREFWAALNRGEYQAAEYKRIGKGGKEIWIQASYNPILDRNGKPVKVIKFATDITAAKMRSMEEAGKIAAIGRAQAVIEFNLDGRILWVTRLAKSRASITACLSNRQRATAPPIGNSGQNSTVANTMPRSSNG
jgi:methyl-accepting chemotaxis protein